MADTKTNNTILAPMSQKGSLTGKITAGMISTDLSNYYEKDEVDELLSSKSNVDHNHDDKYPNLLIFNNRLSKKADVSHTHSYNELTDLPDLEDIGIDTSNLATKEELNDKADVDHNHIIKDGMVSLDLQGAYDLLKQIKIDEHQMKQYAAPIEHTHEEYALQTDIPSIDGLATEEYVNEKVDSIDIPEVDLSGLATKEELDGKADKSEVPNIRVIGNGVDEYVFTGNEFTNEEYENCIGCSLLLNNVLIGDTPFINELVYICLWTDGDNKVMSVDDQFGSYAEYVFSPDGNITIQNRYLLLDESALVNLATKEELNSKASTSYVDDAINTALGNIESQLDEIIGEEV